MAEEQPSSDAPEGAGGRDEPDDLRPPPAVSFRLAPRADWSPGASVLFVAAAGFVPAILLAVLLRGIVHPMVGIAIGMSFAVLAAVFPSLHLVVGVDGVSLGRSFHGYDSITRVGIGEDHGRGIVGVSVWLRDGQRRDFHCVVAQAQEIIRRIQEARERFERMRADLDSSVLARRERSPLEWVRALRALGAGAGADHRTQAVPHEALWTAVESIGAEPTVRAAAAVALRDSLDGGGRQRLQELAATTASPGLRVALEAVAAEREEAAVAEALAAAEAAEVEQRRVSSARRA